MLIGLVTSLGLALASGDVLDLSDAAPARAIEAAVGAASELLPGRFAAGEFAVDEALPESGVFG